MSEILQKEKIIIVIRGGNLAAVYSSIPDKSIEIELVDFDSRAGAREADEYLNTVIESGEAPYALW